MEAQGQAQAQGQIQIQVKAEPQKLQEIVCRTLGFRETSGDKNDANGGKYRRGIIYYKYNRLTHVLEYGASIFQTSLAKGQKYDSAGHHKTAKGRLEKHPVIVYDFADDKTLPDFNMRLRQLLFKYGCRSK
ncbi:MAG: hypothetical protein Barrevirus44_2 [Barrevirus sp.]|uniref:Uncharacterized protein n=1 Tax=Barrevirus sp. TaxID=2487763 RepID=A0A3G4ZSS3_9VIRU|nr:MAG: hypothetical protein Barrevirus44_2 [Barrevirus sp.]